MSFTWPSWLWKIAVRLFGTALIALGLAILMFPPVASPLFAAHPAIEDGSSYLRAIAFRDIALGLSLLFVPGVSIFATVLFLAAGAVIPIGDLIVVGMNSGLSLRLLPHLASAFCLILLAVWGRRLA
jgi:hypothetical protein